MITGEQPIQPSGEGHPQRLRESGYGIASGVLLVSIALLWFSRGLFGEFLFSRISADRSAGKYEPEGGLALLLFAALIMVATIAVFATVGIGLAIAGIRQRNRRKALSTTCLVLHSVILAFLAFSLVASALGF